MGLMTSFGVMNLRYRLKLTNATVIESKDLLPEQSPGDNYLV